MIRYATHSDVAAILEIYNDAILHTTAIYTYKPHTLEDHMAWYEQKTGQGLPIWVYEENNLVIGFATFGPFRAYPAFKYTIEHSVYVHKDYRKRQIGTALMKELINFANYKGYATIVGVIDDSNKNSKVMHKKLGFSYAGNIHKAGYKFGKWLDLAFYQLQLDGPETPKED
jgi:phosphinothricin acetyltransferase